MLTDEIVGQFQKIGLKLNIVESWFSVQYFKGLRYVFVSLGVFLKTRFVKSKLNLVDIRYIGVTTTNT